jgi:hypothetical protein
MHHCASKQPSILEPELELCAQKRREGFRSTTARTRSTGPATPWFSYRLRTPLRAPSRPFDAVVGVDTTLHCLHAAMA